MDLQNKINLMKYHNHKPFEACSSDCPLPHMGAQEAQDWFTRWIDAETLYEKDKIADEALPPKGRP